MFANLEAKKDNCFVAIATSPKDLSFLFFGLEEIRS